MNQEKFDKFTYDEFQEECDKKIDESQIVTYHACLPSTDTSIEQGDISGTLGILWPVSDKFSDVKNAAFERLISDSIQWILSEQDLSIENTIVLLQGPLLPKLRGRLLYRGMSNKISIQAITYQTEWLKRFETVEHTSEYLISCQNKLREQTKTSNEKVKSFIGKVFPPMHVDQSTRSWVAISSSNQTYHFETISNMWDSCKDNKLVDEREEEIKMLLKDEFFYYGPNRRSIPLPCPLAIAVLAARNSIDCEEAFIYFLRHINTCEEYGIIPFSIEKLRPVLEQYNKMIQEADGQLIILPVDYDSSYKVDLDNFYSIFKKEYKTDIFQDALRHLKSDNLAND